MDNASRDQNFVPTLIAVSNVDGVTPVVVYADPVTHRLLTSPTGGAGSGDVVGPAGATDNAIARYNGATGLIIQNSAVTISDTGVITVNGAFALPNTDGTNLQVLQTNGAGSVTWASAGSGTVSSVSVVSANGFAGTVATATTTPAITLTTTISGLIKGNGTAISAATDGTDYLSPSTGLKLNQTAAQTITGDSPIFNTLTASELVATTAAKKLQSLAVATYPSLAEIAFVKGVTSAVQTQLNAKQATITFGTGVQTALGVNVGTAGSILVNGGALGTPSSGTVTNLTGTASININGTVGATTPTTGSFTTVTTSGNLELGNASDTTISRSSAGVIAVEGVVVPTVSSTSTLSNKRITKRTGTTTSSATPTINTDNVDYYSITAQTVDITSMSTNLSGTPTTAQQLRIDITGTAARAITWGASFANGPVALPSTTVTTTRLYVLLEYDGTIWRCMASGSTV